MRRIETAAPERIEALRATVAQHDATSCAHALRATIALYRELRDRNASATVLVRRSEAEETSCAFFDSVSASLGEGRA